jgi:hypothetical protein
MVIMVAVFIDVHMLYCSQRMHKCSPAEPARGVPLLEGSRPVITMFYPWPTVDHVLLFLGVGCRSCS